MNVWKMCDVAQEGGRALKRVYYTAQEMEDNETAVNTEYVGVFNRYDKVPRDIWSAYIRIIGAEEKNTLVTVVEVQTNDKA